MPIFAYLAIPIGGALAELQAELRAIPHCQVVPSANRDVLVLVTDTPDELTQESLTRRLHQIPSLQSLSMTFGHTDEDATAGQSDTLTPRGGHET